MKERGCPETEKRTAPIFARDYPKKLTEAAAWVEARNDRAQMHRTTSVLRHSAACRRIRHLHDAGGV